MPYTLVKALVWLLVAFAIGLVIGWLLRNAAVRREMAKARGDGAERERLRQRVAELEPLIDERTRLLAELEACRSQRDRLSGKRARTSDASAQGFAAVEPSPGDTTTASVATGDGAPADPVSAESPAADAPDQLDLAAAAAVLGKAIEVDDLTAIEGIGPKIAELCHGIGIRTWGDLAGTEVSLLRTMLTDAGARYKVHNPSSWPEQAQLLAAGRWSDFQALVDRLDGGVQPS